MNYLDAVAALVEQQLAPKDRPSERAEELYRFYAVLALVAGEGCSLENVHDAWSAWMAAQQPDHDALVPFSELDAAQQGQDQPYLDAILRVVHSLPSRAGAG